MTDKNHNNKPKICNKTQFFICLALIAAWGTVMLILSSQNGEETARTGSVIAEKLARLFFDKVTYVQISLVHTVIRKLAHVFIYAVFGALLYNMALSFPRLKDMLKIILPFATVVCFSVFDEAHKLFISGRHCDFVDICLNVLGGVLGIALVALVRFMISRRRKNRNA